MKLYFDILITLWLSYHEVAKDAIQRFCTIPGKTQPEKPNHGLSYPLETLMTDQSLKLRTLPCKRGGLE